ncbi:anti-anti-sigma factor [Acidovorax sp. SRB_14]|uniref:STAS domain-containing protein n=1 Tax=unclassified Acidovorax TaxID=2684926 RepID=UPI00145F2E1D|nr:MULTISPECIES: STAS domain-containing protein [unclassified Acidovorax]NMM78083.1 anti-anti-sigma factor [Acidovorax sp. SRB_24]NMM80128.1 anti-anti-sigma factor [Acidovorax sp. SRB_14]NMM88845.1 anti-anti-sigma factor [Rhodococcus sp. SRB_17]
MLVLPSELTQRQARGALGMLLQGMRGRTDAQLVVDASALQVFDSSALAVLLECRREALAARQAFAIKGLPPALARMAALYGVAPLLPSAA